MYWLVCVCVQSDILCTVVTVMLCGACMHSVAFRRCAYGPDVVRRSVCVSVGQLHGVGLAAVEAVTSAFSACMLHLLYV